MAGDYAILAQIYDDIGLSAFSRRMTPLLMDFAQQHDWLGRRVFDIGCGTGASIEYLSQYPYTITGIDSSPEMLAAAQNKLESSGANVRWLQQDIRELSAQDGTADMVLALNVLNELNSLRDLEAVFARVHRLLEGGKLFIFDMFTVQGLAEEGNRSDLLLHDSPERLAVMLRSQYDYERQMHTAHYLIFHRASGAWERLEARRILRAFPVQAIASLLQRCGFAINHLIQPDFAPYEPSVSRSAQVIFFAEKQVV